MSVTCGFFNAIDHDRLYNATQMSSLFDGIINDGVFMNIGTALTVKAKSGMQVNVGIGRAWFDGTWTLNDAILPLNIDTAEVVLGRIDAVVLEVNKSDAVRACSIKVVKGTAAASPKKPSMTKTDFVKQHPLAYITVNAGVKSITQANIQNCVGTSACPYVTGILKTIDADNLLAQWQQQYTEWYNNLVTRGNNAISQAQSNLNSAYTQFENDNAAQLAANKTNFDTWFNNLTVVLDSNTAGHLQNEINSLYDAMVEAGEAIQENSEAIKNKTYPIATSLTSSSNNSYAAGAKAAYDFATSKANTAYNNAVTKINETKTSLQKSFQDGVDTVYNACVSAGSTPSAKTPAAISTAIGNVDRLSKIYPGLSHCLEVFYNNGINPSNKIVWVPLGNSITILTGGYWSYHTLSNGELPGYQYPGNYTTTSNDGSNVYLSGSARGAQLITWRQSYNGELNPTTDVHLCICY